MTMPVFIARLNCSSEDGDNRFHIIVGVFSTKNKADESLENFIEGVLELERPNVSVDSKLVEEFSLDVPINEDE
jgi:hypothetical protein